MISDTSKKENLFLSGMILSMFCWGLSWASGKVLTGYGNPQQIALYRFVLTFVSLLVILLFTKEPLTILRSGAKDLLGASLMIALYTYFFFLGLSQGKPGAGGVLVTTLNPVISYVIMLITKRQKPGKFEIAGLFMGIIAGAVLLKIWVNWQTILESGNSYFLLASCTWAVLSLFTSRSSRYGSPVVFSLWMYGICSVLMFSLVGLSQTLAVWQKADMSFWGNLFFSATITTALATTFYFVATARLGAGKASSFIFLVPLSAALGSLIFLGEVPQINTIAGGLLGIIAVYLINRK
jgi:drug/metabolite transporter (DMT)-like permease